MLARRQCAGLVLMAGCGRIAFDPITDGQSPPCVMPTVFDSFDSAGAPCGSWGSAQTLVSSDRHDSALYATPAANAGQTFAGCTAGYDLTQPSFVEVSAIATAPSAYTVITLYANNHHLSLVAYMDTGTLDVADEVSSRQSLGGAPYDPVTMRWWRIQPIGPSELVAQVSPDGRTWTQLGSPKDVSPDLLADGGTAVFGAGVYANEVAPGTAVFQGWNTCP